MKKKTNTVNINGKRCNVLYTKNGRLDGRCQAARQLKGKNIQYRKDGQIDGRCQYARGVKDIFQRLNGESSSKYFEPKMPSYCKVNEISKNTTFPKYGYDCNNSASNVYYSNDSEYNSYTKPTFSSIYSSSPSTSSSSTSFSSSSNLSSSSSPSTSSSSSTSSSCYSSCDFYQTKSEPQVEKSSVSVNTGIPYSKVSPSYSYHDSQSDSAPSFFSSVKSKSAASSVPCNNRIHRSRVSKPYSNNESLADSTPMYFAPVKRKPKPKVEVIPVFTYYLPKPKRAYSKETQALYNPNAKPIIVGFPRSGKKANHGSHSKPNSRKPKANDQLNSSGFRSFLCKLFKYLIYPLVILFVVKESLLFISKACSMFSCLSLVMDDIWNHVLAFLWALFNCFIFLMQNIILATLYVCEALITRVFDSLHSLFCN